MRRQTFANTLIWRPDAFFALFLKDTGKTFHCDGNHLPTFAYHLPTNLPTKK